MNVPLYGAMGACSRLNRTHETRAGNMGLDLSSDFADGIDVGLEARSTMAVMVQPGVMKSENAPRPRRAMVAVAMVAVLLTIDLIIVGLVLSAGRDHDLTIRRIETVEAAYAAEAGVNMSIRELMLTADDDGDGTVCTISDDGDNGNDPALGNAQFRVTIAADVPVAGQSTLTSQGRSGGAMRKMAAVVD